MTAKLLIKSKNVKNYLRTMHPIILKLRRYMKRGGMSIHLTETFSLFVSGQSSRKIKKALTQDQGLNNSRRLPTLPHSFPSSTIGA